MTVAKLSTGDRDHMAHRVQNIYCGKSLLKPLDKSICCFLVYQLKIGIT